MTSERRVEDEQEISNDMAGSVRICCRSILGMSTKCWELFTTFNLYMSGSV